MNSQREKINKLSGKNSAGKVITRACVHIVLQTSGYLMHDYSSQCRWIAVDSFFRGSVNTHRYSPPLPWISVNQFIQACFRYNKLWVSLRENLARENTCLIFSATKTAGSLAHDVCSKTLEITFGFSTSVWMSWKEITDLALRFGWVFRHFSSCIRSEKVLIDAMRKFHGNV